MGDLNNRFSLVVKDSCGCAVLRKPETAHSDMRLSFTRPKLDRRIDEIVVKGNVRKHRRVHFPLRCFCGWLKSNFVGN